MAWTDITSMFRASSVCTSYLVPLSTAQAALATAAGLRITVDWGGTTTFSGGHADAAYVSGVSSCSTNVAAFSPPVPGVTDGVAVGIQVFTSVGTPGDYAVATANSDTHVFATSVNDTINCCGFVSGTITKIEISDGASAFWRDFVNCKDE